MFNHLNGSGAFVSSMLAVFFSVLTSSTDDARAFSKWNSAVDTLASPGQPARGLLSPFYVVNSTFLGIVNFELGAQAYGFSLVAFAAPIAFSGPSCASAFPSISACACAPAAARRRALRGRAYER
jgi:hypothetical protein